MPTKRVANEITQVIKLMADITAHAPAASTALLARAQALGVTLSFDPAKVLLELVALTKAGADAAGGQDIVHGVDVTGHSSPTHARDDVVVALRAVLRNLRVGLTGQYGAEQVAEVFPKGATPETPSILLNYAGQIGKSLADRSPGWTALESAVVSIDLAGSMARLTQLTADLQAAMTQVAAHDAKSTGSLVDSHDARADMHELHKGLLTVGAGMLEMGGQTERADHLTAHHHLGKHSHHGSGDPVPAGQKASE